eukprot:TRINITY_DN18893_c0_g3_i1.p1 TRINITY_DN18893_c0_g3~~TRINITY_DN18893_c0_g3_i1.p1  ORF type:complete len:107 (-),score=8.79 TRINITY_DN18893_c0_g3_i1:22-342(-)
MPILKSVGGEFQGYRPIVAFLTSFLTKKKRINIWKVGATTSPTERRNRMLAKSKLTTNLRGANGHDDLVKHRTAGWNNHRSPPRNFKRRKRLSKGERKSGEDHFKK